RNGKFDHTEIGPLSDRGFSPRRSTPFTVLGTPHMLGEKCPGELPRFGGGLGMVRGALVAKEVGLPPETIKGTDTIDVWIDSGVSHKAVCAMHPELRDPADMYLEATDQHRGWFQSSLMTSIALNNRAPYKTCVTHGFVVDL